MEGYQACKICTCHWLGRRIVADLRDGFSFVGFRRSRIISFTNEKATERPHPDEETQQRISRRHISPTPCTFGALVRRGTGRSGGGPGTSAVRQPPDGLASWIGSLMFLVAQNATRCSLLMYQAVFAPPARPF